MKCFVALFLALLTWTSPLDAWTHGFPTIEGFVSTRARLLNNSDSTNKQLMCRTAYVATENLTSIKVFVQNYYTQGTPFGTSANVHYGIEFNGATTEVKFSGVGPLTIADSTIVGADYANIPTIPAGSTWYGRVWYTNTSGIYYNAWNSTTLSESCSVAVSGLTDQSQGTGAITGGTPSAFSHPFIAVVAHTTHASVLIIGDSRTTNVNCAGSIETDCDGKSGNIAASMGTVPFVDVAVAGEQADNYAAGPRSVIFPYGSQVIVALGINDLICGTGGACASPDPRNPSGGFTASQISAAMGTIFSGTGAPKKYAVAVEPRTSSSDGWLTTANQSAGSTWVPNRITYNTLVRGAGVTGQTGFYDLASVAESSLNSTLWFVTPSPPYTGDGLHGNNAYQTLLKNSGAVVPASYP